LCAACAALLLGAATAHAQLYASWGYNAEQYARTDLRIVQPSQGNDFTLHGLAAHDNKGWTDIFRHQTTVPQYSVRIGWFLPRARDWAVELNFEHARYMVTQKQHVQLTGLLDGERANTDVLISSHVLTFWMNNGANFLLVNAVRRVSLVGARDRTGSISLLLKAGVGALFPHAQNQVFAENNAAGFQFGGVDAGIEAALRLHVFRGLYLDAGEKGVFGRYRGIKVSDGHADLNVWAHNTSLSFGWQWK